MDISFTVAGIIILIILTVLHYRMKYKDVLPGPKGVPYLGLYPFLTNENVLSKMEKYKRKYGSMFSFIYGGTLYISLNSIKAMLELHLNKADYFTEKYEPTNIITKTVSNGLFFLNGESRKVLRIFFIKKFEKYECKYFRCNSGMHMQNLVDWLVINCGHINLSNITEFLIYDSALTMKKVIFGDNGATAEDTRQMVEAFDKIFKEYVGINSLLIGPLSKLLLKKDPELQKCLLHMCDMKRRIRDYAKRIESCMNEDEPTCVIEEYYKERNKRRQNNVPSWRLFSDETLVDSLFQFVGHGILSITALCVDVVKALIKYPNEQEKIFFEIMQEIGQDRHAIPEDRTFLPYTNAFIKECIRTSKFMPFTPSLVCTKELFVRGYRIPVGSITLLDFWSAHHDSETFQEPYVFNPFRYFSFSEKPEDPVLFGMGKHMCTGEAFVMIRTFLYLVTIVKNFEVADVSTVNVNKQDFTLPEKVSLAFIPRAGNCFFNRSPKFELKKEISSCILS